MQPGVEISEVCRREGMNPTMFYTWRKKLMASAAQVFDEKPKKRDVERERMEREMSRMKDVIAEITAENLELKKGSHFVVGAFLPGAGRRQCSAHEGQGHPEQSCHSSRDGFSEFLARILAYAISASTN